MSLQILLKYTVFFTSILYIFLHNITRHLHLDIYRNCFHVQPRNRNLRALARNNCENRFCRSLCSYHCGKRSWFYQPPLSTLTGTNVIIQVRHVNRLKLSFFDNNIWHG